MLLFLLNPGEGDRWGGRRGETALAGVASTAIGQFSGALTLGNLRLLDAVLLAPKGSSFAGFDGISTSGGGLESNTAIDEFHGGGSRNGVLFDGFIVP
jgi:hypothetical protein